RCQARLEPLLPFTCDDVPFGKLVDQPGPEQCRRIPLRDVDAAWKGEALLLAAGQGDHLIERGSSNTGQQRINLGQRFLAVNAKRMDDSLPGLLAGFLGAHGEGRDVVIEPSAAPATCLL